MPWAGPEPNPELSVSADELSFYGMAAGGQTRSRTVTITNTGQGVLSWSITDDQDWMQLLNTSGDLPDPLSFDSRPATVDPRFLGTEATVPDKPLRSDSHGLTTVHQSMDLFGSG